MTINLSPLSSVPAVPTLPRPGDGRAWRAALLGGSGLSWELEMQPAAAGQPATWGWRPGAPQVSQALPEPAEDTAEAVQLDTLARLATAAWLADHVKQRAGSWWLPRGPAQGEGETHGEKPMHRETAVAAARAGMADGAATGPAPVRGPAVDRTQAPGTAAIHCGQDLMHREKGARRAGPAVEPRRAGEGVDAGPPPGTTGEAVGAGGPAVTGTPAGTGRPVVAAQPAVAGNAAGTVENAGQDPMHREAGPLRHGNPRGNPNLAPRCGARTRAGCPCRAPAIRGRLRCRMHGGRSTGPRTQEGLARLRAARTRHGLYSASVLARMRYDHRLMAHGRVLGQAVAVQPWLPPDCQARLLAGAPELTPPARALFEGRSPCTVSSPRVWRRQCAGRPWPGGPAVDPLPAWRAAIAQARQARREGKSPCTVSGPAAAPGRPGGGSPIVAAPAGRPTAAPRARPHAP